VDVVASLVEQDADCGAQVGYGSTVLWKRIWRSGVHEGFISKVQNRSIVFLAYANLEQSD